MANIRYRKRGNKGLWAYEIRHAGKTMAYNSGFKTKKLAETEAEPILQELRCGKRISKDISLAELYQEWVELKILPSNRSEETKKKYLLRKKTIIKLFGDKKVTQIRASEYQRIMNSYGKTVSRNFLGRLNTSIHQSIQMAVADKILVDDFTQHVELFSSKKQQSVEDKYLHAEKDYLDLISAVKEKFDYQRSIVPYIIYFLLKTGMRFGELIALTWDEVDFEKGFLKTYRRFNTLSHKFVPPKNKTSIRIVPIDEECIKILQVLHTQQEKANKELGIRNHSKMIFQHFGYIHSVPDIASVNKALNVILNKLDIYPIITTKGARHTYGSYLWHKGFDLGVIAKILGHKDISMLVEVYGHTLEEKIYEEFNNIKYIWKERS